MSFVEQVVKEMKSHPVTLIIVLSCTAAIIYGFPNFAKASEVEALKVSIERQNKVQTCRWLSDKIDNTENAIRLLEKDGADDNWIEDKKKALKRLKERYEATTCGSTVY